MRLTIRSGLPRILRGLAVVSVACLLGCASSPRFKVDDESPSRVHSSNSAFEVQEGIASYYAEKFHGRTTSNGEVFDMYKFTAAHRSLPFGTKVRVKNLENGRQVIVRINDRGPFKLDRIIDLSYAAAKQLQMMGPGTAKVQLEIIEMGDNAN
ncbi:MAG: septal ring lytic transglycosylase RlpA family protein [Bacteroidota bacterium]